MSLPPFPVDDLTLTSLKHALQATLTFDDDGNPVITGAEYDIHSLMSFLSGYDPTKVVPLLDDDGYEIPDATRYDGQLYTERCVISALVAEVRRLRARLCQG